jgi:putative pyruvate formate lyase activating enzyme
MDGIARKLLQNDQLRQRAEAARQLLSSCTLCPRQCRVDRLAGETGICRTAAKARIASYAPHFGEEAPLVGSHDSGAIFLAGCNLCCCFCQNYGISQGDEPAQEVNAREFAAIMLELQAKGCHNINLVTPSHVVPQILEALIPALEGGLNIPLVYNCSGYESLETLALLDGVVDIYLPDAKFWEPATAARYTGAADYPQRMREALLEMHRQVGGLVIGEDGCARSGLLIRHLLMPGLLEESRAILRFIAEHLPADTYVNVMGQYHPCGRAGDFAELNDEIPLKEYRSTLEYAQKLGLTRLDQPDIERMLSILGF